MEKLKEKVAYLYGLTKGLNVSEQSVEGKVILNIVDVLDSFADEFYNMNAAQRDLEDYVETIDEDLTDLEEEIYEEEYDEYIEAECPLCHDKVAFESSLLAEDDVVEVTCPNCGGTVYETTVQIGADMQEGRHPGL